MSPETKQIRKSNGLVEYVLLDDDEDYVPKITICFRENISALKTLEPNGGAYVLFESSRESGRELKTKRYVGKSFAKQGVFSRISKHHNSSKGIDHENKKIEQEQEMRWGMVLIIHGHLLDDGLKVEEFSKSEILEMEFQLDNSFRELGKDVITPIALNHKVNPNDEIEGEEKTRLRRYSKESINLLKSLGCIQDKPSKMPPPESTDQAGDEKILLKNKKHLQELLSKKKLEVGHSIYSEGLYEVSAKIVDEKGAIQIIEYTTIDDGKRHKCKNEEEFRCDTLSKATTKAVGACWKKPSAERKDLPGHTAHEFWFFTLGITPSEQTQSGTEEMAQLISAGKLKVGQKLISTGKHSAEAEIIDKSGGIRVKSIGGKPVKKPQEYLFSSLTRAATKVGSSSSGWDFWRYEYGIPLDEFRIKSKKRMKADLSNLLQEGLLKIGQKLISTGKHSAEAEITDKSGGIRVKSIGGKPVKKSQEYLLSSLTRAATKVGSSSSGWEFWQVAETKKLKEFL